jgi:hypothetical protein
MGEQVPPWTRRPCDQCGVEHQATRAEPRPGPLVCDVCAVHLQYAERIRELEAALAKAEADRIPRPRDTWHDDIGAVLWWLMPVCEPPYAGHPLDDDFPEYVTHWTPIPLPVAVEAEARDEMAREGGE